MTDKPDYERAQQFADLCLTSAPNYDYKNLAAAFIEQGAELTSLRSRVDRVVGEIRDGEHEPLEAMLRACVPGGDSCDPQHVADAIRDYYADTLEGDK